MDATELLLSDHRKVDSIFQQFEKGGNSDEFSRLFAQLKEELTVHTQIEEEIFYPAVRNNPDTANLVAEAYQEHAEVKQLLAQVESMDNTSTEWGQRMTEMMRDVQAHVQMEETEIFPKVRQHFDKASLDQLGQQLEQRKSELKGQAGATASANYQAEPSYEAPASNTSSGQLGSMDATGDLNRYNNAETNRDMNQYDNVENNRDMNQPSM